MYLFRSSVNLRDLKFQKEKKADWAAINSGLKSIDWENEVVYGNIHENWRHFENSLLSLMDQHIPTIGRGPVAQLVEQ